MTSLGAIMSYFYNAVNFERDFLCMKLIVFIATFVSNVLAISPLNPKLL
jgi:hypothetical protein